jgi:phosphatidylinositol alpha-1,6-mannosyltransferase
MRVLFVCLDAFQGVGGIQRFNARLLRALDELRAEGLLKEVVSLSLWDPPDTPAPGAVLHRGFGRRKAAFVVGLAAALRRHRPDLVLWGHVLLVRLLPLAGLLSPRARHALVVHGWEVWGDPAFRRIPAFERPLVRRVQRVISVSRTTAERMARAYGLGPERFLILPNATDLKTGAAAPRRREGPLRLLTVTRLSTKDSYKGVDVVLAALARLRGQVDAEYVVVGDGQLGGRYEDQARALGLAGAVRFVGRVGEAELADWYRWADVFVLPSSGEGFGIVYLEAWSHGLPVVAAEAGGAAEVVEDGRTGLLVPPGDLDALAAALARLAADPELRERLGTAGRAKVKERYTHERFRARLVDILASLRSG